MLVKLYDLKDDWSFLAEQEKLGVTIRKPIGPEKHLVESWVGKHFHDFWASEADQALSNRPVTCFIAIQNQALIGFACYDATALSFFRPDRCSGGMSGERHGESFAACLPAGHEIDRLRVRGHRFCRTGRVLFKSCRGSRNSRFVAKHLEDLTLHRSRIKQIDRQPPSPLVLAGISTRRFSWQNTLV